MFGQWPECSPKGLECSLKVENSALKNFPTGTLRRRPKLTFVGQGQKISLRPSPQWNDKSLCTESLKAEKKHVKSRKLIHLE